MQNYQSQLQTAASKDEALTLAIGAAENLMKALKLSSDVEEKKQLKKQCGVLMDVAHRIKNSTEWTAPVKQESEVDKNVQIGQWAANIESSASSDLAHGGAASMKSLYGGPQTLVDADTSLTGNTPISSHRLHYCPSVWMIVNGVSS